MTKEWLSNNSDSTAMTKPMDVVNVLPICPLPRSSTNKMVKTAHNPTIETNEYPIISADIDKQTKEIHGISKINGFCCFSVFNIFVKPTRNNNENGIVK